MAIVNQPPIYELVINDEKKATLPWILWANNVAAGDVGTAWTPTFQNLTEVGTAVKTGIYYILSNALVYFRVIITPGTNTSAVAGTTYIDNFPLTLVAPAGFDAIVDNANSARGTTNASNNRLYTPSWTNITSQVILSGLIEAT